MWGACRQEDASRRQRFTAVQQGFSKKLGELNAQVAAQEAQAAQHRSSMATLQQVGAVGCCRSYLTMPLSGMLLHQGLPVLYVARPGGACADLCLCLCALALSASACVMTGNEAAALTRQAVSHND